MTQHDNHTPDAAERAAERICREIPEQGDEEFITAIIREEYADLETENRELAEALDASIEALEHSSRSIHHPACKCKGDYAAYPEYCTCQVTKSSTALATARATLAKRRR